MNYDPYQSPSTPHSFSPQGELSPEAAAELYGTQGWVRFTSVMMFIVSGFMLLSVLLSMSAFGSAVSAADRSYRSGFLAGQVFGVFLVAVLYVYPAVLLAKYASAINRFRHSRSMTDLAAALRHQRFFWRFIGIIMIVVICIFVFAFLAGSGAVLMRL